MLKSRRFWLGVAVIAALAIGLDVCRLPERQLTAGFLLLGIDAYQATLSRLMPVAGVQCRFEPTCSHYAEASIRRHGALAGSAKAAWRISRCGPWTEKGTVDLP